MKKFGLALVCSSLSLIVFLAARNFNDVETLQEEMSIEVKNLAIELKRNFPGSFYLNFKDKETIGDLEVPLLKNGDWVLGDDPPSIAESFSNRTNAQASIFVKIKNEFVIISSSLKNAKGESVVGTALDRYSPAYKSLITGKRYTDQVLLSGKEYMADFDVFRDRNGAVIGAYLVAVPLNE